MERLRNSPFWKVLVAAIVVAIVCNVFFGWSFWLVSLVILSFWVAEKTTKWLYVVTVLLVGVQAFNSFLPVTAKKSSWVTTATDLFIGSKVDSVQIKANQILEREKNLQKNNLLPQYHDLLKKGKVDEARDLLDSLDNLFSPKKEKVVVKVYEKEDSEEVVQTPEQHRILSFYSGIHLLQINAGEIVRIYTYPSQDGCGLLSMSSPAFAYQFKFDGQGWKKDGPYVQYPYMRNPTCLLYSEQGDKITIKVL
jgi:hypothetical protein